MAKPELVGLLHAVGEFVKEVQPDTKHSACL